MAWVACGKASPWATAVTFRVRCSRRPVTAAAGVAGDRHLAPGQGLELGVQAGLVALDDQQVVGATPGQVGGMFPLGMQRVGGNDRTGDIETVQQRAEHGDLVGLGVHLHLAQDRALRMVEGGEQVAAALAAVTRSA